MRACEVVAVGLPTDAAEVEACETNSLESASATAVEEGASTERTPDPERECDEEVEERF